MTGGGQKVVREMEDFRKILWVVFQKWKYFRVVALLCSLNVFEEQNDPSDYGMLWLPKSYTVLTDKGPILCDEVPLVDTLRAVWSGARR